ncbi:TerB N-terminal domain-containing protein [Paenibacillus sp. HN-1]|uniref:TerB N-terminal domain-containing protein n=1 Tax=Paenibacillus TaxID=44249 RepID=UPI001CA9A12C|nr:MULTISPECIES: TerB N-terminal domain-containing protein [Paenibacillus]MBY9079294.1 TerB N-terminal domain-containing protein [Paenibacillus sp. CGMCC 1.18879]MBY9087017.1 TerB N-terminal domain-containing protein [Paenibacillus sinensis]
MSDNGKTRFTELIWEGEEQNIAIPSREEAQLEEARRSREEAGRNEHAAQERTAASGPPEQLVLWEAELPRDRREQGGAGRAAGREVSVPPAASTKAGSAGRRGSAFGGGDGTSIRRTDFEDQRSSFRPDEGPNRQPDASATAARPATTESLFVERAKEMVGYTEQTAEFIPFKSYWPTYGHMTASQSKWYFYWRNEVRHGQYPETDLSYVFLHVYELINGVGWETPRDGYEQLTALWEAYRGSFKRLDHYLGGWIADFAFVHKLDIPLRDIVMRAKGLGGDLAELELVRCLGSAPEQLTLPALALMSDYEVAKSKFYTGPGQEALERYAPLVVALVDSYALRKHGQKLLDMYPPGPPVVRERYLFRSAVYDISLYGYSVLVPVARISKSPPLRSLITRLLRLTENKLRALMDYRGRLKGISIDKEIEELVEKFLEREFRKAEKEARSVEIVIDSERLHQLRSDSDVVRQLLTVEEQGEAGVETFDSMEIAETIEAAIETTNEMRQVDTMRLEAQPGLALEESPEKSGSAGQAVLETPDLSITAAPTNMWEVLADALTPLQREALLVLAGPDGIDGLYKLAEARGGLPDLLIDEINETGMDVLGDLLIDGDQFSPEYTLVLPYLKR